MKKLAIWVAAAGLALAASASGGAGAAPASGHYGYVNGDLTYTAPDGDVTYFCALGKGVIYAIVDVPTSGPYTGCAYARHLAAAPVHQTAKPSRPGRGHKAR